MLLLIDTATEQATLSLADQGKVLFTEENPHLREQAAWLHAAIQGMLETAGLSPDRLQAIAVSAGPGSYTGLRIGMAAAKGLCFALNIPLILVNTLEIMAAAMAPVAVQDKALICPMIDARREEVFTALYSAEMEEIMPPRAMILEKTSFEEYFLQEKIIFSGSGAEKWKRMTKSDQAIFIPQINVTEIFAKISTAYFAAEKWSDTAYAEPVYLKEFYTHSKK